MVVIGSVSLVVVVGISDDDDDDKREEVLFTIGVFFFCFFLIFFDFGRVMGDCLFRACRARGRGEGGRESERWRGRFGERDFRILKRDKRRC